MYGSVGGLDTEEQLHKQAIEGYKADSGLAYADTPWCLNDLAMCDIREGKLEEVEVAFRRAYDKKLEILGHLNLKTPSIADCLARSF